ncbi:MAG: TetR/AcrR family transcriptional regulator [Bacteroidetes bacterium]|nr:MAG: TetR/AcrR family transcriptional regulator [Bacteroidota bacterium]
MKDRIIKASDSLFKQYGFSKTTADEIARQAGMSKRTLYKYFESKLQILDTLIEEKLVFLKTELNEILGLKIDFPEKMRRITTSVAVTLSGMSVHFLEDLQRNTPQIWEKISGFRKEMVHDYFPMLLDEGIKEGHFKKTINKGIAVLLMMNAMEIIINPKLVSALPDGLAQQVPVRPEELFDKIIEIIYDGIHQGDSIF